MEGSGQNNYELILATDLDGTFLEGNSEIKNFFYNELIRLRDKVMLIYVTGRPVEIVKHFCENRYLPHPHYVIGDHGTHVVDGVKFEDVDHVQTPIIKKWNNSNNFLKSLLSQEKGIQLQPINPPYRVAYYYDPLALKNETLERINQAGFDAILSCDMYLDIVPQGVNKGTSLMRIVELLNLNHEQVVTCGDSLNDLSLFLTGRKSIAVGNSEPKLVDEIRKLNNVYHSSHPGLYGIIDGLQFYDQMKLFKLN